MLPRPSIRVALTLVLVLVVPRLAAAALVCAANRAVVNGGDSVTVMAYSDDQQLKTGKFSSQDGVIRDRPTPGPPPSFEAQWTLPLLRGTYEITATATVVDGVPESCHARVVVTGDDLGPGVESGRQFLPPSGTEQGGYGSYTYFLCPAPVAPPVRTRCESAVKAIVDALPEISQYDHLFSKPKLNTLYVPVASLTSAIASAADVLSHYDFARARRWLDNVDQTKQLQDGPYLVTVAKPLSATKQPFILQNLSGIPPSLVASWITAYLRQLAQQTAYGRTFEPSLALRMRTVLGVLALAVPDIRLALGTVISSP